MFDIDPKNYSTEELAILEFQIKKGLELIEAKRSNKPMDISEQISFVSEILGISLIDLVHQMVSEINDAPQSDPVIDSNSTDQEVLDFLQNSTDDALEYEERLKKLQELKNL